MINELVKEIHEQAVKSGWWNQEKSPLISHMLMVSEIAEATEEVRNDSPSLYFSGVDTQNRQLKISHEDIEHANDDLFIRKPLKPEGEMIELADCVIRIFDYFGHQGWDMEKALKIKMDYNKTRSHRHGGKKY